MKNKVYFPAVYPLFGNFVLAKFESATTPKKRGAKPLHFRQLFSTFVGDILNYGSVTLFLCGERRKFKHNRENKWHCPLVVSSRYRRGVVAYFIYWVSYDLSH